MCIECASIRVWCILPFTLELVLSGTCCYRGLRLSHAFRPVCSGEHFNLLAVDYAKCAIYTFTTILISLCKTRGKFHTTLM